MKIDYDKIIENESEREFYEETHDKILNYLKRKQKTTFWDIVRNVQGSDRRVLRLLNQMSLADEIKLQGVQISPSGLDTGDVYNDGAYIDDVYSPPVLDFNLDDKYNKILEKLKEISKNKPKTTFVYDQRPVTLTSSVKRVAYLDYKGDLVDKKIVVIGDDDLTSIAIGLTRKAKEVVIFDIDERLIDFINKISEENNLNVKAYKYDLTKEIPSEFKESFDVFLTDPTPNKEAFELFISVGLNLLRSGKGKVGYVSFFPSHQTISNDFQEVLAKRKAIITDMIPGFTEYQFIPETYKPGDLELLKELDTGEEKINFYENHTRIETTEETDRSVVKLDNPEEILGKATKRVLENPELDPAIQEERMSSFLDYYKSEIKRYGGFKRYVQEKAREKKPLLDRVRKYAPERRVIETGCGTGTASIFLANQGFYVAAIDKDKKIIDFAKEQSRVFKEQPIFERVNMLELKYGIKHYDVAFNHGVLEHYSDKDIIKIINAQLGTVETFVFSVPSDFFRQEQAIVGDERFLSKAHWKKLIGKSNGKLVETFDYFYDSEEPRIKFLKKLSKLTGGILPIKKPYLGFVVQSDYGAQEDVHDN